LAQFENCTIKMQAGTCTIKMKAGTM